jgi:hypothetical protein
LKIILFKKEGVKGMLPACCLPLWGKEGVTLIAAAENYRMTLKKRVSTEPEYSGMTRAPVIPHAFLSPC